MGVDYWLFRMPVGLTLMELTDETALPFGSQAEVLEYLCNTPGFERDGLEENDRQKVDEWYREQGHERGERFASADVRYIYPNCKGVGRFVSYSVQEDPVIFISIRKTYVEDLWPIIHSFQSLAPLIIWTPTGALNISDMPKTYEEWMQMNNNYDYARQSSLHEWYESYS